jgi:uncharacterized protein (TIGR02266 family)
MADRDANIQDRKFRRRTVRILVDYSSEAGVHCEYATTLGAGGLFIESEQPLPRGTALKVRFRLPGGEGVHEIEGRVAWAHQPRPGEGGGRSPGMGIEFTDAVSSARLARQLEDLPERLAGC